MLLTHGQVSMALSSGIVFIFTVFLFVAGYGLQQQTVRSIKVVIQPRIPSPEPSHLSVLPAPASNPNSRAPRTPGTKERRALQEYLSRTAQATVDWNKLAHVQLVRNHRDLCTAVIILAEFQQQKSPAKRVLAFPRAWAVDQSDVGDDEGAGRLATSRRLLRIAARRYGAVLRPMESAAKDADGRSPKTHWFTSLFALHEFDRVLYLDPPGLLIDSEPLDSLLAYTPAGDFIKIPGDDTETRLPAYAMLLTPSSHEYERLQLMASSAHSSEIDLLDEAFPEASTTRLSATADGRTLISLTSTLSLIAQDFPFNSTDYLSSIAYVRFSGGNLPGPEYDIPFSERIQARPKNEKASVLWSQMYEKFRQKRQDICGLDLEYWSPGSGTED